LQPASTRQRAKVATATAANDVTSPLACSAAIGYASSITAGAAAVAAAVSSLSVR